MSIIKTLKSSISEKGNYCYSLPVETTKEIVKDVEQLQEENKKYKEVINKTNNYIKQHSNNGVEYLDIWEIEELLEILKGSGVDE